MFRISPDIILNKRFLEEQRSFSQVVLFVNTGSPTKFTVRFFRKDGSFGDEEISAPNICDRMIFWPDRKNNFDTKLYFNHLEIAQYAPTIASLIDKTVTSLARDIPVEFGLHLDLMWALERNLILKSITRCREKIEELTALDLFYAEQRINGRFLGGFPSELGFILI